MGTIKQVRERYRKAYEALPDAISTTVQQTSATLMDLNRDQLLQGRDAEGNLLSPTYTQDPYFTTREAAARYSKMKYKMEAEHRGMVANVELFGEKPTDVPNLLVNGNWFFNHFFIKVTKEAYSIGSTGLAAPDIERKYPKVYGLAPLSKEYYYFMYIRPTIKTVYGR